jgi:hypothetical protein
MLIGCCTIGSYYAGADGRADVKIICRRAIGPTYACDRERLRHGSGRRTRPIKWNKAREAPALARVGKRVRTRTVGEQQSECHMPGSTRRLG